MSGFDKRGQSEGAFSRKSIGDREPSPKVGSCYGCGKTEFLSKFYDIEVCDPCLKDLQFDDRAPKPLGDDSCI